MTDETHGTERRVLRDEVVEIEGVVDRLEATRCIIDKSGSPKVSTGVRCKTLKFKKPLQAMGDTRHLYNTFEFHGWLDSSVAGKEFWLKEFYNHFGNEDSKVLYMQGLTVQEDDGFLRMYEFADVRKWVMT